MSLLVVGVIDRLGEDLRRISRAAGERSAAHVEPPAALLRRGAAGLALAAAALALLALGVALGGGEQREALHVRHGAGHAELTARDGTDGVHGTG
jgi:hypothetical protein